MSTVSGGGSAGNAPVFMSQEEKPKNIFGAISHLEIVAGSEERGTDIPELFATMQERMDTFNLGMRAMLTGSVISLLLAPIATAVLHNYIPIFGKTDPDIMDKALAYVLSFGYSIAYLMLFIHAARLPKGKVSSIYSNTLLMGMTVGAVFKMIVATLVYGVIFYIVLKDSNMNAFFGKLIKLGISKQSYEILAFLVITFKQTLLPSISLFFYTTIVLVSVPWAVVIYGKIAAKRQEI